MRVGRQREIGRGRRALDFADRYELLRFAVRQRFQQDAIDDREDGGRDAERQGERPDNGRCVHAIAAEPAEDVADVEQQVVHASLDGIRVPQG